MMRCIIFLFVYISSSLSYAGVYRCVAENGEIEFRDRGCQQSSVTEVFLPYIYEPTDPNLMLEKSEVLEKAQKTNQRNMALEVQKKKKQAERQQKAAEKAAAKNERRLARCQNTQQKIKELEAELRAGCKLKRCNTLKKQLAHRQKMQQRYCTPP